MKKVLLSFVLYILSNIAFSQSMNTFNVYLEGYKSNDTIKFDDFINSSIRLILDNKDYKVESFNLLVWAGFVKEYKSDSCTITNEMKSALVEIKSRGFKTSKIYFHDIKIRNPNEEPRIAGDLLCIVKIK